MRSPWTLGLVLIAIAGMGVSGIGGSRATEPAQWAIFGVLVVAGLLLFIRRPWTFWVAIGAAAVLALTGVLAMLKHPELALPVPPILSIVIGLYLVLRAVIARPQMGPPKPRRTSFDDEA